MAPAASINYKRDNYCIEDSSIQTTTLSANVGGKTYRRNFKQHVSMGNVYNIASDQNIYRIEEIFAEEIRDIVIESNPHYITYSTSDTTTSDSTTSSWCYTDTYAPVTAHIDRTDSGGTITFETDTLYFDSGSSSIISNATISRNNVGWITIGYGEDSEIYIDGVDFKLYDASFSERMQWEINQQWAKYCREEREKEKDAAENTANNLLKLIIGEDQTEVYKKTGRIFVKGKNGLYHVKKGGGISKIEGNKIIDFCVHLDHKYKCPPTDHAIALKLLIEENDKKVIDLANRIGERIVEELPLAACV